MLSRLNGDAFRDLDSIARHQNVGVVVEGRRTRLLCLTSKKFSTTHCYEYLSLLTEEAVDY